MAKRGKPCLCKQDDPCCWVCDDVHCPCCTMQNKEMLEDLREEGFLRPCKNCVTPTRVLDWKDPKRIPLRRLGWRRGPPGPLSD